MNEQQRHMANVYTLRSQLKACAKVIEHKITSIIYHI